jgi:hypothetical protein
VGKYYDNKQRVYKLKNTSLWGFGRFLGRVIPLAGLKAHWVSIVRDALRTTLQIGVCEGVRKVYLLHYAGQEIIGRKISSSSTASEAQMLREKN